MKYFRWIVVVLLTPISILSLGVIYNSFNLNKLEWGNVSDWVSASANVVMAVTAVIVAYNAKNWFGNKIYQDAYGIAKELFDIKVHEYHIQIYESLLNSHDIFKRLDLIISDEKLTNPEKIELINKNIAKTKKFIDSFNEAKNIFYSITILSHQLKKHGWYIKEEYKSNYYLLITRLFTTTASIQKLQKSIFLIEESLSNKEYQLLSNCILSISPEHIENLNYMFITIDEDLNEIRKAIEFFTNQNKTANSFFC
ncbi:hypothetical protein L2164_02945 [Pectobacterium brasiliense]|uniref:hypothetical protein n=1 Tax=Pectobacterium brasiliense TaxID=180957 RepID=UPI00069C2637|nr:hypothetical protein [Pectobacterium brasiliense]MCG5047648.1 hypothetical protein [Pectobacterium brasiliense]